MAIEITNKLPEDEEIGWMCFLVSECNGPAIPWAEKDKCHDCKEEVWYDPQLILLHPQLRLANKYCMYCLGKRAEGKELITRYPHREN